MKKPLEPHAALDPSSLSSYIHLVAVAVSAQNKVIRLECCCACDSTVGLDVGVGGVAVGGDWGRGSVPVCGGGCTGDGTTDQVGETTSQATEETTGQVGETATDTCGETTGNVLQ